jgi:endonuclease-8
MSGEWDRGKVIRYAREAQDKTVDDLLLNQRVFTGLGNIMKNEILWRQKMLPTRSLDELTARQLGRLVSDAHAYAWLFYELKKKFMLRKSYKIYRQGKCPRGCESKIVHVKTGSRSRMSHYCPVCQK